MPFSRHEGWHANRRSREEFARLDVLEREGRRRGRPFLAAGDCRGSRGRWRNGLRDPGPFDSPLMPPRLPPKNASPTAAHLRALRGGLTRVIAGYAQAITTDTSDEELNRQEPGWDRW